MKKRNKIIKDRRGMENLEKKAGWKERVVKSVLGVGAIVVALGLGSGCKKNYDMVIELTKGPPEVFELRKGEVVKDTPLRYLRKEKDGTLVFEYTENLDFSLLGRAERGGITKIKPDEYKIISK